MLNIELKVGESVRIGNYATVTLEDKSGQRARLSFKADKSIPITRVREASTGAIAAQQGITGEMVAK